MGITSLLTKGLPPLGDNDEDGIDIEKRTYLR